MAAGSWKDWAQGEVVSEAGFQDIQDSIAFIYASESAANTALTNKVTGTQFYDSGAGKLKIWNGSAWVAVGGGITNYDAWYVTSNVSSNGDLTSNWARNISTGFAQLGSGMSESSGIFTFPDTGFWEVQAHIFFEVRSQAFPNVTINVTTNNSTYASGFVIYGGERAAAGGTGVTHSGSTVIDVTDTTQVKVKFTTGNLNSTNIIYGNTNTRFQFKRLGDT